MKLQIRYNNVFIDDALAVAQKTYRFADVIEIGSLLLFNYGVEVIKIFQKQFPEKPIYIDSKIAARPEESVKLFSQAGAKYISVLAGIHYSIIQKACNKAHELGAHIVLDCIDDPFVGQSFIDAKTTGIHAILVHINSLHKTEKNIDREWDQIQGNTTLPIYMKGGISKSILPKILTLKPKGIVVGSAITLADNPEQEAETIKQLIS